MKVMRVTFSIEAEGPKVVEVAMGPTDLEGLQVHQVLGVQFVQLLM